MMPCCFVVCRWIVVELEKLDCGNGCRHVDLYKLRELLASSKHALLSILLTARGVASQQLWQLWSELRHCAFRIR